MLAIATATGESCILFNLKLKIMAQYCDDPVPVFQADLCANDPGRVIAVAFIRTDATITDYTSVDEWNADITAGLITVIKNTKGSKEKSGANTIDGFGREQNRTVGRDFTLAYSHPDVIDNIDFYDALNFNSSFTTAFYTQSGHVFVEDVAIANIDADYVITDAINDIMVWDVAVSWSSKTMPQAFVAPGSVFEIS